jgi:adenylate cyclase
MVFGTVRRKLTALVVFSALSAMVAVPIVSWQMREELIDRIDDRVPEAVRGFDQELADDVTDLETTSRALSEQEGVQRGLREHDVVRLLKAAEPFRDAYPDIDVVFYDAEGALVTTVGCAKPLEHPPQVAPGKKTILPHGCESAADAPIAIAIGRVIEGGGTIIACLPLDSHYFENTRKKLGTELAFEVAATGARTLAHATPGFPLSHLDNATREGVVHEENGQTWAIAWFQPESLASAETNGVDLRFTAGIDVTGIKATVRKSLAISIACVLLAMIISVAIGWRLASRMASALSRVNGAMQRLKRQEYVKVDVVDTGDELEDLAEGFNSMVEGLQERDKLRNTMGKYMTEELVQHLLAGEVELGGKQLEVTIMFCDLRDFTTFSEKRSATEIVEVLNEYFTEMVDCVMSEGGVVDKYIGDNIMAVFGAPVSRHDDATRAVRATLKMRDALAKLNARWIAAGKPTLRFGIGLHTGQVVAGNIGSAKRMEYTVIGDAVNLASRLESKTKELKTDLLISEATYERAKDTVFAEQAGEIHVKGREQPVTIYQVVGLKAAMQAPSSPPAATPVS